MCLSWAVVAVLLAILIAAVHPLALLAALRHAHLWLLALVAGCSLLALLLRALRWHLLMVRIAAPNTLGDSLVLFTAAQAAQLVPGGLLLLPVLQRSQHGTPVRRTTATVLVQDLFFSLLTAPVAVAGVRAYPPSGALLALSVLVTLGTGWLLWSPRALHFALRRGQRIPRLRTHMQTLSDLQASFAQVARSRVALWGAALDLGAIGLAGAGLTVSLHAVGVSATPWADGVAVYALGTAAGTLSALPGGIGANEDVSALVLAHMGLVASQGVAALLLFRASTVLLRMTLGWSVLLLARRRLRLRPTPRGLLRAVQGVE